MTMTPIRIVIADDHDLVRAGIGLLLGAASGLEIVGEARSGPELTAVVERLLPDVVITDLAMPGGDGIAAIEALRRSHPALKIIALSMYDTADFIRRAMRAGADAYVLKGAPSFEIETAVRQVMEGRPYFSPQAAQRLAAHDAPRPEDLLTPRQIEILGLLARGLSSKEIGFDLGLSSKTVDVHRAAIMSRLGLNDVASLTLYAVRVGLVDPEQGGRRPGGR
ncbi:response regulator transcription factor [Piscinibacter sakaiensis]|uniref:DNA-binding response regulator, LuxR family n=1 Tax=Piscinibacter sakaiensis TaxID=1547922 RepID=A0A0K8NZ31_PISS1|nr:response regulator transcription factor [Piscinibacter sakaiensis]GAP35160.1 DNA-binding response regulator, LuxR family [Piscinibacter sakaiensis]